jgi:hypothetical protein
LPDFLLSLKKELGQLRGLLAVHQEPLPATISIPLFSDDDAVAYQQYVGELDAWLDERNALDPTLIVTVDVRCKRPTGLRPPWTYPKAWLDYRPSFNELREVRGDLTRDSNVQLSGVRSWPRS